VQSWYVARTKPRREAATAAMLEQRDVEVYLPTLASRRRASGHPTPPEPLFPGYLFVHLDVNTADWLGVRSSPGVAYFLGCGESPSAIPEDLIAAIRLRADPLGTERYRPAFRRGDLVIIRNGPFTGLEAVFDGCLSARGRVRVFLEILERHVPVTLDVRQIAKAESSAARLSVAG
jgi:transcription elongation factor/antiterminator RfaH